MAGTLRSFTVGHRSVPAAAVSCRRSSVGARSAGSEIPAQLSAPRDRRAYQRRRNGRDPAASSQLVAGMRLRTAIPRIGRSSARSRGHRSARDCRQMTHRTRRQRVRSRPAMCWQDRRVVARAARRRSTCRRVQHLQRRCGAGRELLTPVITFQLMAPPARAAIGERTAGRLDWRYSYRSASIGSSRDALMAGNRPKKMPTLAEKPMPSANDHQGSETGKPESQWTIRPMRAAEEDAEQAADRRQEHRLDQELPEDLAAARAERLADADLARALGDRDHHDRHDADAADHQRDRGDHDEREERRLADLVPDLQDRVLRHQVEVVRLHRASGCGGCASRLDLAHRLRRACALARHDRDHRACGTPPG